MELGVSTFVYAKFDQRLHGTSIDILRGIFLVKCVVKLEGLVIQIFADAINLQLAIMYHYQGIETSDRIIIISTHFFHTHRSFTHTDANLHVFIDSMMLFHGSGCMFSISTNHTLKINITWISSITITLIFGSTVDFGLLHDTSTFISISL